MPKFTVIALIVGSLLTGGCGLHLVVPGEFRGKKSIEDPPLGRQARPETLPDPGHAAP